MFFYLSSTADEELVSDRFWSMASFAFFVASAEINIHSTKYFRLKLKCFENLVYFCFLSSFNRFNTNKHKILSSLDFVNTLFVFILHTGISRLQPKNNRTNLFMWKCFCNYCYLKLKPKWFLESSKFKSSFLLKK